MDTFEERVRVKSHQIDDSCIPYIFADGVILCNVRRGVSCLRGLGPKLGFGPKAVADGK